MRYVYRRSRRTKGLRTLKVQVLKQVQRSFKKRIHALMMFNGILMLVEPVVSRKLYIKFGMEFMMKCILPTIKSATSLLLLDREIGDIRDTSHPYQLEKRFRTIELFEDDDQAANFTNFSKHQLIELNDLFGLDEIVRVPTSINKTTGKMHHDRFHREQLLIYFLIKLKFGHPHTVMSDQICGGSDSRNSSGYRHIAKHLIPGTEN